MPWMLKAGLVLVGLGLATPLASQDCVILLHGIARSPDSLSSLQQALVQNGYTARSFAYPDRTEDLAAITTSIQPALNAYAHQCPGKVHFVTHSMGGLVARAYLHAGAPVNLGKVVMLAPPNQGSEVADYLHTNYVYRKFFGPAGQQLTTSQATTLTGLLGTPDYPLGIIAGTRSMNLPASWWLLPGDDDGAVTVSRTYIKEITATPANFLSLPTTHTFMMNNPTVQSQTIHFLQTGNFRL